MAVTALVINYNAGALLGDCVQSLIDNGVTDVRVVDNASTDGSIDRLRGRFGRSPSVQVLVNPTNRGFGPAVNDHLAAVESEHLLVINPDCRLEPGALRALEAALQAAPQAGLAGPRVVDSAGRFESAACRHFPTPRRSFMSATGLARLGRRFPGLAGVADMDGPERDSVTEVEATSGACMLLRSEAFRALGGFDEGYTLHAEDLDLMFRLRSAGWQVLYVPGATAVHVKGVSSASRPLWVHRQKHRGLVRFFNQHLAADAGGLVRWLYPLGVWSHWAVTWPLQWLRR